MLGIISSRGLRFLLNGLVATVINYALLVILIEYIGIKYTGLAFLLSAIVGISVSFIGNRLFVFRSKAPIFMELVRFKTVYAASAIFQGMCMTLWSDIFSLNYTIGFAVVTATSVLLSYVSNRSFVFK